MILIILSIVLISLFLSIDNIIPILLIADSLPSKKKRALALLVGLVMGAILRIILLFFANILFRVGSVIYIISALFLLYIGLKGLIKSEESEREGRNARQKFGSVVFAIALIDISLSVDNIAALVAITNQFNLLMVGVIISVVILFGLSFSINSIIQRVKGIDTAAYIAILFLSFKFFAFPFGVNVSNTLTSTVIILICIITVIYSGLSRRKPVLKSPN